MEDKYNLNRFIEAQELTYSNAFSEIKTGKKVSHWIWFIFPQIIDLGKSPTSKKYSLRSKDEALAYYKHIILGKRLVEVCRLLLEHENKSALGIFGHPDYKKVHSCVTLFHLAVKEEPVFKEVIDKYFNERLDDMTLMILSTL